MSHSTETRLARALLEPRTEVVKSDPIAPKVALPEHVYIITRETYSASGELIATSYDIRALGQERRGFASYDSALAFASMLFAVQFHSLAVQCELESRKKG